MSVSQYITARVYAKRMVQFLRMRQRIKQIEKERTEMLRLRRAHNRIGVQAIQGGRQPSLKLPLNGLNNEDDGSKQPRAGTAPHIDNGVQNLANGLKSNPNTIHDTDFDVTEGVLLERTATKTANENGDNGDLAHSGRDLELKKKQSYKSIIEEEEGEHQDDKSDQEKDQHLKNVQSLIKNGKAKMLLNGHST